MKYRIFDSLDRPSSPEVDDRRELYDLLEVLQSEADDGTTYSIAQRRDDSPDGWIH